MKTFHFVHLSVFECLCIPSSNRSNHNYKVLIALHFGLHVEKDGPHTTCNHAKKLKNVARCWLNKCGFKNFKSVLQSNLELIPFQVCVPFSPSNCFMLIATKWVRGLLKTCTFMAMWCWCLGPSSQVDGHLGLLGSMTTLWHACKCYTKL
jgi:hypothetical protein